MSGLGILFLAIFSVTLFVTYITVRRSFLRPQPAGLLCAAICMAALFAFGMAEDLQVLHALVLGIAIGLVFTSAIIIMAAFFQANQLSEREKAILTDKKTPPK